MAGWPERALAFTPGFYGRNADGIDVSTLRSRPRPPLLGSPSPPNPLSQCWERGSGEGGNRVEIEPLMPGGRSPSRTLRGQDSPSPRIGRGGRGVREKGERGRGRTAGGRRRTGSKEVQGAGTVQPAYASN